MKATFVCQCGQEVLLADVVRCAKCQTVLCRDKFTPIPKYGPWAGKRLLRKGCAVEQFGGAILCRACDEAKFPNV